MSKKLLQGKHLRLCSRLLFLVVPFLFSACLPRGANLPLIPFTGGQQARSGWIVLTQPDGNIYTIQPTGDSLTPVTTDGQSSGGADGVIRIYEFPVWSPDNRRLAYIEFSGTVDTLEQVTVYTSDREGQQPVEVFSSQEDFAFYLYWSPDSQMLSFLTAAPDQPGFTLRVALVTGGEVVELNQGIPIYMNWAPDNRRMLVHTGRAGSNAPDDLSLVPVTGDAEPDNLDMNLASFKTPAWSPDGRQLLLAAEDTGGEEALLLLEARSRSSSRLTEIEGQIAFGWSPGGRRVTYIDFPNSPGGYSEFGPLVILDPEKPDRAETISSTAKAFFWSPDGRSLAYFEPASFYQLPETEGEESASGIFYRLMILDVSSGESTQAARFYPTYQFSSLLNLFDQYQHSTTIWSPDSRNLLVAALDTDGLPGIYVVDITAETEPRFLATGEMAYWSWK